MRGRSVEKCLRALESSFWQSEVGGPFQNNKIGRGEEEPECIRKWRKEWLENIKTKDEEEAKKKEELKLKAKKELEDW